MSLLVLSIVWILSADPQSTAGQQGSAAPPPETSRLELPVSLERIQRALAHTPVLRLDKAGKPVFRVEVFGDKPTIEDILGPDYLKGPAPQTGMTHQEFLTMVTPKDVQGYAAFSNTEAFTVAATSLALQWALRKAIHSYQTAQDERARESARKEVEEALADLERARRRAGMPPR